MIGLIEIDVHPPQRLDRDPQGDVKRLIVQASGIRHGHTHGLQFLDEVGRACGFEFDHCSQNSLSL